jgi:hypothetical protein
MLRVKDWNKFQHFRDRKPPWIKLYRDVLDDLEWHELDPVAAKCLTMIWLIASETDGNLPTTKKLAFRLRLTEKATESIVSKLSHWLEQTDINAISSGYQHGALETETETETETEGEKEPVASLPDWLSSEVWDSFKQHRGKKFTELAQKLMLKKLQELKEQGHDPNKAIENSIANGWSSVYPEKQKGQQNGTGYISERDKARKRVAKELCGYDPDAINGVSQRID